MCNNGIIHVTSAPYYCASNGLAEQAVQTVKLQGIKRTPGASVTVLHHIQRQEFLQQNFSWVVGYVLDWIDFSQNWLPELKDNKPNKLNSTTLQSHFEASKEVTWYNNVKDFSTTAVTWIPGKIAKMTGPLSYHMELINGSFCAFTIYTVTCAFGEVTTVGSPACDNLFASFNYR